MVLQCICLCNLVLYDYMYIRGSFLGVVISGAGSKILVLNSGLFFFWAGARDGNSGPDTF